MTRVRCALAALATVLCAACNVYSAPTPVSGPPGVGWTSSGGALSTPAGTPVGIGTSKPAATLHVAGDLLVDADASLLPQRHCEEVMLTDPSAGDLGAQLAKHLRTRRCVDAILRSGTTWTWNEQVTTEEGQRLTVEGEGYQNGASQITVIVQMTENTTRTVNGSDYRDPVRLEVGRQSFVRLSGLIIQAQLHDSRPLSPWPGGALFVSNADGSTLDVQQTRILSDEDVIGIGSRAFVNVLMGWTLITKSAWTGRPAIWAVKSYVGSNFGGGFAFVHCSHTALGAAIDADLTKVVFPPTPGVTYSGVAVQSLPSLAYNCADTAADVRPN